MQNRIIFATFADKVEDVGIGRRTQQDRMGDPWRSKVRTAMLDDNRSMLAELAEARISPMARAMLDFPIPFGP